MSSKSKRLGSLADIYQKESLDGAITKIKLTRIRPSAEQPRRDRTFGVDELAESIKRDGLLSPLVVTREGEGYRVIAGERRYHALKKLNWAEAECRIISRQERDYWRIAIIENLQRENLTAEEEASALLRLKKQENLSDADLAGMVGKSRNYITEILGIAALPQDALRQCSEAGIENRNLLIQAVQAYKRGQFDAFLQAFRAGEFRTVRAAREWLHGDSEPAAPAGEGGASSAGAGGDASPSTGTSSSRRSSDTTPGAAPADPGDFSLQVKGEELIVRCPDARQAKRLRDWIKKKYLAGQA